MSSLTIRLTEIPEDGLKLEETLSLDQLRAAMHVSDDDACVPLEPLEVSLALSRFKKRISVVGRVHTRIGFACATCNQPGEAEISVRIKETFLPVDEFAVTEKRNVDLEPQDFKFAWYENDELDLGEYLGEEVNLALPMYPRCAEHAADAAEPDGERVAWQEEWDVKPEDFKAINPAWQAQLEAVKDDMEDKLPETPDGD